MNPRSLSFVGMLLAVSLPLAAQYASPQPQYSTQPQYAPQPQYPGQPQYPAQPQYAPQAQYPAATSYAPQAVDPSQLSQLLSPIALYPDPLLAAMLPASTHPDQIAAAANLVSANTDPGVLDQQPWDDSVKAMAHYPAVVTWMAQNAEWTSQLGNAVASDESTVMSTIQQLRANAQASGLLVSTPQQQVITQNNYIAIQPAQPGVVYVPYYDPEYVETRVRPATRVSLQFGIGYNVGSWSPYSLDWRDRSVWIDRHPERSGWQRIFARDTRQTWHPAPVTRVTNSYRTYNNNVQVRVVRPTSFADHATRWSQPTRTPGLQPTGRTHDRGNDRDRHEH
jgi:hypothetical protein